ncbi:MAG: methionyl-tRNA formyltransferase [Crocinitomicaceae bacterium]|nr:methionyl-tRNA formyltransferase [Crocinitomicaceae bacterium]
MKIGLLCSGNLGLTLLKHLNATYKVEFVMTDSKSDSIIAFSTFEKIPVFSGNPRNNSTSEFTKDKTIDVLISINYLFIIEKDLIDHPKMISFNIHGSLLPKYRGRTPHVWAIINNEKKTGITAHIIDEGCDTGEILEQITIPISDDDSGSSILEKFADLYVPLVDSVLTKIKGNSLKKIPQKNELATYFGKRTPDDGKINWNWQKERIRNWVRAQKSPYPGAFTFFNENKIIIDEIVYSDLGYSSELSNGTVISLLPLTVKTPNGAVEITQFRNTLTDLKLNDVLN